MEINELEEFISYVRSTGACPKTNLFNDTELLHIENKAFTSSDNKVEKIIRKIWKKRNEKK